MGPGGRGGLTASALPEDTRDGQHVAGEHASRVAEGELDMQGHAESLSALHLHQGEGAARNMASLGVTRAPLLACQEQLLGSWGFSSSGQKSCISSSLPWKRKILLLRNTNKDINCTKAPPMPEMTHLRCGTACTLQ